MTHEMLPDGESTAKWAFREPGFFGSLKPLIYCARCGEPSRKGKNEPQHFIDILKPTFHFLCDDCYDSLPD